MIYTFFAGLRTRLSGPVRVAIAAIAAALCFGLAWYGTAVPIEILLLAVVAVAASLVGFPLGAVLALVVAAIDFVARQAHHSQEVLAGAVFLAVGGLIVSALYMGEAYGADGSADAEPDPGQRAFPGLRRVALPAGA
ncbi:MAG: hypothetical protein ACYDGM_01660, partial [Vulcanimicrobiaceae bacterium]